jgi:uncharacterized protein (UPF0332 family)
VNDRGEALLARARTEIDVARTLEASDFPLQAASRAYYAAFYAAEAALLSLGETRSKHSGVLSAFGLMVIKERGFDRGLGGELRRLFELRGVADYLWLDEPQPDAYDPVAAAERFVEGVIGWLATQPDERPNASFDVARDVDGTSAEVDANRRDR